MGLASPRSTVSIFDALEQHSNLLITGEPGAGKSTMSSYLARSLSRIWLREDSAVDVPITEPVVPLRVFARSLDGNGSWSAVLAEGACRSFGRSLREDPDSGLFAGRVQGARWLVLVDGLDEIPDSRLRRDIIRSVAQHARPDSDYRFVVTTRTLPAFELAPLQTGNVGNYVIERFDRPQLEEFASKWFAVQQMPSPTEATKRFLRETSDGRLRELVRNPLLATIAAVSAVKEPDRPLPASRLSLYERFCNYLGGSRSGRRDLAQLRRHQEDHQELLACVQWLHRNRLEALGVLARRRLESQDKLWQVALTWARDWAPEDVTLVDGWEDHLWEELVRTGILVARERELRFLHQSFAEFLAAKSHADAIGDDFDELDPWIRQGLRDAERTLVLFTVGIWATRPGRDMGTMVDRLLSSPNPERLLFAGRLMAEGISIPDQIATRVINRLFTLVRNLDDADSGLADEVFEVLGALFDHPSVLARLYALAGDTKTRWIHRISALDAFERLGGGERTDLLLADLLPSAHGQSLHRCAQIALRLGEAAINIVQRRALQISEEPNSHPEVRTNAVEVIRILGRLADVADLARSVLGDMRSTPQQLRRVAEVWVAAQGESTVAEIGSLASARPAHDYEGRAQLAAVLHKAGDANTAESLAGAVLEDEMANSEAVVTAAETLLSVCGAESLSKVLLVVDRWSEQSNGEKLWNVGNVLEQLAAYPEAAVVSRARILLERFPGAIGAHSLIQAWLAVEPVGESILDLTERGAALSFFDQAWTAKHLQDAGQQAAARELAERVLRSAHCRRSDYKMAASVLLKADRAVAVSELARWAAQTPQSAWLAGVIDALRDPDSEVERIVAFCARELLARPRIEGGEFFNALRALVLTEGESGVQCAAEAARTRPELSLGQRREIAYGLAAVAQLDLAKAVWVYLLEKQGCPVSNDVFLVQDLLHAGVEQWAAERMQELIDDPDTAPERVQRLRQMLAWLTIGCGPVGANG